MYYLGMTIEARWTAAFSEPLSLRTGLILPHMLGFFFFFFPFTVKTCFYYFYIKKKNGGSRCRILFFLLIAFQILHVFFTDVSIHCALINYAYIWFRVYG
jgi:hypothetical protein